MNDRLLPLDELAAAPPGAPASEHPSPGVSIIAVRNPERIEVARRLPLRPSEPVQIAVTRRAEHAMLDHALDGYEDEGQSSARTRYEVKGFLYGTVAEWGGSRYSVEIREIVRLRRGDHDRDDEAHVGASDHDYAHRIVRGNTSRFGGLGLVGFYHSHPRHDLVLSSYDVDLLDGLFGAPYQVAIVIQPDERKLGYFIRRGGQHSQQPAVVVTLPVEGQQPASPPRRRTDIARYGTAVAVIAGGFALTVGLVNVQSTPGLRTVSPPVSGERGGPASQRPPDPVTPVPLIAVSPRGAPVTGVVAAVKVKPGPPVDRVTAKTTPKRGKVAKTKTVAKAKSAKDAKKATEGTRKISGGRPSSAD